MFPLMSWGGGRGQAAELTRGGRGGRRQALPLKALGSGSLSGVGRCDSHQILLRPLQCFFLTASCSPVLFCFVSVLFIPSPGFPVVRLLSVRVREALVGTSSETSHWRPERPFRKQLKGQQLRSHPVPKFQPKILQVIFVPVRPRAASAAKWAPRKVDRSIQSICCEPSFGSAAAEFVGWALGRELLVAFPHSYGDSPSVGCSASRAHLSHSSPFIWHSAPTGGQESENRLCYDRDLQIL